MSRHGRRRHSERRDFNVYKIAVQSSNFAQDVQDGLIQAREILETARLPEADKNGRCRQSGQLTEELKKPERSRLVQRVSTASRRSPQSSFRP